MPIDLGTIDADCLASLVPVPFTLDSRPLPVPGAGFYDMVRARGECGIGTYGVSTDGVERPPVAACP